MTYLLQLLDYHVGYACRFSLCMILGFSGGSLLQFPNAPSLIGLASDTNQCAIIIDGAWGGPGHSGRISIEVMSILYGFVMSMVAKITSAGSSKLASLSLQKHTNYLPLKCLRCIGVVCCKAGKREAEDAIEKQAVSAKKQKVDEKKSEVKTEKKAVKKKVETSSDEDPSSESEQQPKTPATPKQQTSGSKTLFVGNLSFSVEQADVENFFKAAGEIVDVRFAMNSDNSFKGFGHVEFASAEAAEKALRELNGEELLGRPVRLDLARERGASTPYSGGKDTQSFQKGGRAQGQTIFVRGFNKYDSEDQIRSSLEEHFGSCGEVTRVSIPKDQDGAVKGMAYIDFKDSDSFKQALELNGSEFGESTLSVEEARPRGDGRDSAGGGRGGGWSGGRGGGRDFGGRVVAGTLEGEVVAGTLVGEVAVAVVVDVGVVVGLEVVVGDEGLPADQVWLQLELERRQHSVKNSGGDAVVWGL
ncbi:UNVERIFIED_CONTAM: Nucleolin 2 [Sesamum latifolium]|uniref:Nucleolin 2 n=1 Tax=Sesamum latifolium TaxID=2727402 RepID=A0AAW2WXS9_9LAMI